MVVMPTSKPICPSNEKAYEMATRVNLTQCCERSSNLALQVRHKAAAVVEGLLQPQPLRLRSQPPLQLHIPQLRHLQPRMQSSRPVWSQIDIWWPCTPMLTG